MPYIVIHRDNGRAIYLLDHAPIIDEAGLHGADGAMLAHDIRPETHHIVAADPPEFWVPGVLAWGDGVWTVVDAAAYNAAYNAALAEAKAAAVQRVNAAAGAARAAMITVIPGQDATYQIKEAEAKAYAAAFEPDPADYPYLAAEAAALGLPLADLAATVAATALAWHRLNAAIEATRRGAITRIETAVSFASIDANFPINWPS